MPVAGTAPRPLQARLAGFQRALNEQFDACRRAACERRGAALRAAVAGVALLCHLQQHLLQPLFGAVPGGLDTLRDLTALSAHADDDAHQRAVAALLEGLVQLQFAQIDVQLAEARLPDAGWTELDGAVAALLAGWPSPRAAAG